MNYEAFAWLELQASLEGPYVADNLSPAQRRRSMQNNKATNTGPERTIRRLLRTSGLKYRSQYKQLPGKPDFILPDSGVAMFVHGCFWHAHTCQSKLPTTNRNYWEGKLSRNVSRHRKVKRLLREAGWRPLTVWECQLMKLTSSSLLKKIKKLEGE